MSEWPAYQFRAWKRRMGWSNVRISEELCISRTSLVKYLKEGAPHAIKLACETLEKRKEK
jgi:hypothetical protein